jgi:hypothetical protein
VGAGIIKQRVQCGSVERCTHATLLFQAKRFAQRCSRSGFASGPARRDEAGIIHRNPSPHVISALQPLYGNAVPPQNNISARIVRLSSSRYFQITQINELFTYQLHVCIPNWQ